ncbi:MAG: aspartate aminotransferase family protein [Haloferacaceae archaeon]
MDSDDQHRDASPIPGDVLAGTRVAPAGDSLTVREGSGAYVTADDGREFVDYKLGSGPMLLGHAHPEVVEAIRDRAGRGTTFYAPNRLAFDLAERIVDAVPCGDALKFVSTGTEATYLAMRLARAHTGRSKVLTFGGSYHGWHDHALVGSSRAGDRLRDASCPTVDTAGAAPGVADEVVLAPFNDLDRTAELVEAHADELACVVAEPMMRSLPPVEGFLEGLRSLCDDHGIVLVFDEVVTGFRLAWGGAQAYYGVEADVATYGKVIGGGTPVGAVCGDASVLDAMRPDLSPAEGGVETGGTLNGNPLGMAAGLATLDVLDREDPYPDLHAYGERLQSLFADVLADADLPAASVGEGPVVDYALTDEPAVRDWRTLLGCDDETKAAIDAALFEEGILKSVGGKMYVSTRHGDEEFERTAEAVKAAVAEVARDAPTGE